MEKCYFITVKMLYGNVVTLLYKRVTTSILARKINKVVALLQ